MKRKYIDENKVRAQKEIAEAIPHLIEFGDENDLVALAKTWKVFTEEEIRNLVILYRDAKRERARRK